MTANPRGLLDGVRVVGPSGRERRVSGVLEDRAPPIPTTGQEPQAMNEHDRAQPRRIGFFDLLFFVLSDRGHRGLLLR